MKITKEERRAQQQAAREHQERMLEVARIQGRHERLLTVENLDDHAVAFRDERTLSAYRMVEEILLARAEALRELKQTAERATEAIARLEVHRAAFYTRDVVNGQDTTLAYAKWLTLNEQARRLFWTLNLYTKRLGEEHTNFAAEVEAHKRLQVIERDEFGDYAILVDGSPTEFSATSEDAWLRLQALATLFQATILNPVMKEAVDAAGLPALAPQTYPVARPDGTVVNVTVPEN